MESRKALDGLKWYARKSYDLACNWKVYVDNYLDGGYHVNTVHPGLAGVLDYREYRTVCDGNTVLQSSPIKPAEGDAGRTRTGDLAAYWWVFPNFMLNIYAGVMDTNLVLAAGCGSVPRDLRLLLRAKHRCRDFDGRERARWRNRCKTKTWGCAKKCSGT